MSHAQDSTAAGCRLGAKREPRLHDSIHVLYAAAKHVRKRPASNPSPNLASADDGLAPDAGQRCHLRRLGPAWRRGQKGTLTRSIKKRGTPRGDHLHAARGARPQLLLEANGLWPWRQGFCSGCLRKNPTCHRADRFQLTRGWAEGLQEVLNQIRKSFVYWRKPVRGAAAHRQEPRTSVHARASMPAAAV